MSEYFRSLSGSLNPVEFAEDLGYAADRAQGVLNLVVDALAHDPDETNYFALQAVLRELSDMRDSIDTFIGLHSVLAGDSADMEGAA
jgi:hypothetical protein